MPWTVRPAGPDEIPTAIAIDDSAGSLFTNANLHFDIPADHPFAVAEVARWTASAHAGHMFLATRDLPTATPEGLLVLGLVNDLPHLDQLSVRPSAGRQGLGSRLLAHAITWAADRPLWLETYAHIPWNRPYYERHGFTVVDDADAPSDVRAYLREQRRWLPDPDQRVAMCRVPTA